MGSHVSGSMASPNAISGLPAFLADVVIAQFARSIVWGRPELSEIIPTSRH